MSSWEQPSLSTQGLSIHGLNTHKARGPYFPADVPVGLQRNSSTGERTGMVSAVGPGEGEGGDPREIPGFFILGFPKLQRLQAHHDNDSGQDPPQAEVAPERLLKLPLDGLHEFLQDTLSRPWALDDDVMIKELQASMTELHRKKHAEPEEFPMRPLGLKQPSLEPRPCPTTTSIKELSGEDGTGCGPGDGPPFPTSPGTMTVK